MTTTSKPFHRHPALDLTRLPFSSSWWSRLVLLVILLSFAFAALILSPALHTNTAPTMRLPSSPDGPMTNHPKETGDLRSVFAHLQTQAKDRAKSQPHQNIISLTLKRKETLSDALLAAGISAQQSFTALQSLSTIYNVRRARPGLAITVAMHPGSGALQTLQLKLDYNTLALVARQTEAEFLAERLSLETEHKTHTVSATIPDSLYLAAERENMPAATILSLIRALSYRVDFQRDIRAGDRFKAMYAQDFASDGAIQDGAVLYAELDLGDRVERLYRFEHPKTGREDYFDATGESMRRLLMRTPIDGARLTSGFGKRRHPVLGYVKSHQGVDFGAPTGTPIYAAGDGVIERANRFGSYGNYVRIKHARGYKTAYAHLSKFAKGMKPGRRVRQGQVIGYVGATGRVTGAHLHYEVHKDKKRVNPMRLDLPTGEVLSGAALKAFQAHKANIDRAFLKDETIQTAAISAPLTRH